MGGQLFVNYTIWRFDDVTRESFCSVKRKNLNQPTVWHPSYQTDWLCHAAKL